MSDPPYGKAKCENCENGTDPTTLTTCNDCDGTGEVRFCDHGIHEYEWCPQCPSGGA